MGRFATFMEHQKEVNALLESFSSAEGFDDANIGKYRVYVHEKNKAVFDSSYDTMEDAQARAKDLHAENKEKAITILNPNVDKKEAKKFDKGAIRFQKLANRK